MLHELKSWVGLFEPIARGEKTHDVRVMDRDFRVGDILILREWNPMSRAYTGRDCRVMITYITSGYDQPGHNACAFSPIALHPASCILSIKKVKGITIPDKKGYYDLTVPYEVNKHDTYFLIYVIYSTGDSFGYDEGSIAFVDMFKSHEKAIELAKILLKYTKSDPEPQYKKGFFYYNEEGTKIDYYIPWLGYFERLQSIHVEEVRIGGSKNVFTLEDSYE